MADDVEITPGLSRLLEHLLKLGWTHDVLRDRGGPSSPTLTKIAKGDGVISRNTLRQFASAIGTDGIDLLALEPVDAVELAREVTSRQGQTGTVGVSTDDPRVLLDIDPDVYAAMDPISRKRAKAEAEAVWYRVAQDARRRADER